MKCRNFALASTLFVGVAAIGSQAAWAQQYVFRSIDVPAAAATLVTANNNVGAVVGCTYPEGFSAGELGFQFLNGVLRIIKYPGCADTCAEGVSPKGTVVGNYSTTVNGNAHGFRLVGNAYSTIDYPGAVQTYAFGVNDSGVIVGFYYDGSAYHSFKLQSGVFTNIDPPGTAGSIANSINDSGEIVGYYSPTDPLATSGAQGYLLTDGSYTFGATAIFAEGINSTGEIVGYYTDSGGVYHGWRKGRPHRTKGRAL